MALYCIHAAAESDENNNTTLNPTSIVTVVRSQTEQPSLTRCQQQHHALFIGLMAASFCVTLILFVAISIGVVIIVVSCYRQAKWQMCTIQQC